MFEIPASLDGFSVENLNELLASANAEFTSLAESDDVSEELLGRMAELADAIESFRGKIAELSSAEVIEAAVEEVVVPEVEEVVEAAAEVVEEAPVASAADRKAALAARVPTPVAVTAGAGIVRPSQSIEIPAATQPLVSIVAAVDVPQFYVGQSLNPGSLADAIHNKAHMLSDSRGAQTVYPVATIEKPFANGYDLEGLSQSEIWDAIAAGSAPQALTASGGWCAPSQIVYDLFEVECDAANLFSLPTFKVTRGGIRWPVFTPHDGAFNPGFVHTEADDIAQAVKPCVNIPCPTFTECRLDAVGLCITAGNLMDRAYPEQIKWFINRAIRAYERNNAIRKLNLVLADTTAVAVPASFGAASALVSALLLQAADYRQTNGLCIGENLDVYAPAWVLDIVKADIARQNDALADGSLVSDAQVAAWFSAANLNVHYIQYWQDFATHPATTWPASVQFLIGYPGSYVEFNGGRLDLGVVRDSVLNSTNDYTAVWFEEFYCVGRRGPQSRLVTLPICPDGEVGGRVAAVGTGACPIG